MKEHKKEKEKEIKHENGRKCSRTEVGGRRLSGWNLCVKNNHVV